MTCKCICIPNAHKEKANGDYKICWLWEQILSCILCILSSHGVWSFNRSPVQTSMYVKSYKLLKLYVVIQSSYFFDDVLFVIFLSWIVVATNKLKLQCFCPLLNRKESEALSEVWSQRWFQVLFRHEQRWWIWNRAALLCRSNLFCDCWRLDF